MQDTYGDPGVAAYYSPQPTFQTYYQPEPITTDDDLNYLSNADLSQKIHSDLNSYFDLSSVLSNTSNISPAVQNNINSLTNVLQNLASSELDGYVNNTVDINNFDEDIYYEQIKNKVSQAFDEYRYNIGNNIGLTANEQTSLLVASTYASSLIQTVDFRDDLNSNSQIVNNTFKSSLKSNALKVNGIFSSIRKALTFAAKVIVATVVTVSVAVVSAVIGATVGGIFTGIDPNYHDPNTFLGMQTFSFVGALLYGGYRIIFKTNLWNWATS